jgi:hypothetical protein
LRPFFEEPFFVLLARVLALAALVARPATLLVALAVFFATFVAALVSFLTSFLFASALLLTAFLTDVPVLAERDRRPGMTVSVIAPAMLLTVLTALPITSEAWFITSPATCEVWPNTSWAAPVVEFCRLSFCFLAMLSSSKLMPHC